MYKESRELHFPPDDICVHEIKRKPHSLHVLMGKGGDIFISTLIGDNVSRGGGAGSIISWGVTPDPTQCPGFEQLILCFKY